MELNSSEVETNNSSAKRYPLDIFSKYKSYNHALPELFNEYKYTSEDLWKKKHISSLNSPEIRAYLNVYINKKNMNGEDEDLYDKVQGLLNKLSNTNFDEIGNEIKDLPYIKKKHIFKLCESIIIKSINEPSFCTMYAKLSYSLLPYYIAEQVSINNEKKEEKIYFRLALLTISQDIFEELTSSRMIGKTFEYIRSCDYSKLKLPGLMKFLAELYNCDVLNDKIINQCFGTLYKLILRGDDYYDALNLFTQTFIKKLKLNNKNIYEKIKGEINYLISDKQNIIVYEGQEYTFKFPKLMYKFKVMEIIDSFKKLEK